MSIKPVFYTYKPVGISLNWVKRVVEIVYTQIKTHQLLSGELSVAIIPDRAMRSLNRRYRRLDKPTDVLSFSGGSLPQAVADFGEIVIAWGVCQRQAKKNGHSVKKEFTILLIHGLLHIYGFDHKKNTEALIMEDLEKRLFAKIYEKNN
jgi:probable rRNA maturation factor